MTSVAVNTSTVTLTANTETVLITSPVVTVNNPGGQGVWIRGNITCTPGTSATLFTVRVRRNSLTGIAVAPAITNGATPAYPETIPYSVLDTTPINGSTYVVTAQQTGAIDNTGTVVATTIGMTPAMNLS